MSRALKPEKAIKTLRAALADCLYEDRAALRRALNKLAARRVESHESAIGKLQARVDQSRAKVAARRAAPCSLSFDEQLPVARARAEIIKALAEHQVVVLCGETGSGKTTQLPKLCLEMGRGIFGLIGHTQPRRIAARAVARRIAAELGGATGEVVGYQTRFDKSLSANSRIKVMTDGILLAELRQDRAFMRYDTLIIDEAHERSLNIDFLLGYLKTLLARRSDLKLIITSATLESDKFAAHFGAAPVLEISGRTYPVDIEYAPSGDRDEADIAEQVADAVQRLLRVRHARGQGDILVFLPGERQISDCRDLLRRRFRDELIVLPLFGRLSAHEQDRVFASAGKTRCVLATNIAETSLTVPGIRYVIDTGLARISRYSVRSKVQQLPVEKISQASARQRAGRCGRLQNGLCVRLYSEEDFLARAEHTEAEILRTNLASVILEMASLKLGDIEDFPFVDKPDGRFVRDGYRLLEELQALDARGQVTGKGEAMARLPVDPRIARILLAAKDYGCLPEGRVVAAALSIPDPRQRPADSRAIADQQHAKFRSEESDFVGMLMLWQAWRRQQAAGSRTELRKWCNEHFLSYPRMREWQDLVHQLHTLERESGAKPPEMADDDDLSVKTLFAPLHRALLSGLLGHVGRRRDEGGYQGTRGRSFEIFPGSGLRKSKASWVVAAGLIETSRLFAHGVAEVEVGWIEEAARHLLKHEYHDPRWDAGAGRVIASETVSLYGLVLAAGRKADFGRVDRAAARQVFIDDALVQNRLQKNSGDAPGFLKHNAELVKEIRDIEARLRRHDVLIDADTHAQLYAARLPATISNRAELRKWLGKANSAELRRLEFSRADLMRQSPAALEQYPDQIEIESNRIDLEYHFERGSDDDGVTAIIPLALLNQLPAQEFEYLVAGLIEEKLVSLLKGLPKKLRKRFVPVPRFAEALMQALAEHAPGMRPQLGVWMAEKLNAMTGAGILPADFNAVTLPDHLQMHFRVVDERGQALGSGRSLEALRTELGSAARRAATRAPAARQGRERIVSWDFGTLEEEICLEEGGRRLLLYPALRDQGDSVSLVMCDEPMQAQRLSVPGIQRLAWLALPQQVKMIRQAIVTRRSALLGWRRYGGESALQAQVFAHLCAAALDQRPLPRDAAMFTKWLKDFRVNLVPAATALLESLARIFAQEKTLRQRLAKLDTPAFAFSVADMQGQIGGLLFPDFVGEAAPRWLARYEIYLQALLLRADKLPGASEADAVSTRQLEPLLANWDALKRQAPGWAQRPDSEEYRWLLEELRVSLFAQQLRTIRKVSIKRLERYWQEQIAVPMAKAGLAPLH